MTARLVLPWLAMRLRAGTTATMSDRLAGLTTTVDNRRSGSVADAWNIGRDAVLEERLDWLILCSTTIRFGAPGGDDFLDELDRLTDSDVSVVGTIGAAWHLVAIRRSTLEQLGPFDSFDRAYCEDSDYIYRHKLAGLGDLWAGEGTEHVAVDLTTLGDAHSIRLGYADPDVPARAVLAYKYKWGGPPGRETLTTPRPRD